MHIVPDMDTLSNVATAATKAVWGGPEANKEPVSGAQGDVTKGEPYDAGNLGTVPFKSRTKFSGEPTTYIFFHNQMTKSRTRSRRG